MHVRILNAFFYSNSDEPGKPGRPEVTAWDADRIDLKWVPPMKDGGAPIESYIVELKDPISREWTKCADVPGTSASVKHLKEGQEYQFRVKAVNKAGPGVPSEPSDKQIAKPRWGEHYSCICVFMWLLLVSLSDMRISVSLIGLFRKLLLLSVSVKAWLDLKSMQNLVVRAGQTGRFDVKIGGEPPPEVHWFKTDRPVEQGPNLQVDVRRGEFTSLAIKSAQR